MEHCVMHRRLPIRYRVAALVACLVLWIPSAAQADEAVVATPQMQLKPHRCVALHQGQTCYQTVQLIWRAQQAGHYCLYQQHREAPLYCWQDVAQGQYQYEFASDASLQLQLVNVPTNTPLATATLEVAWVYKANTRRKTHWRLF